MDLKRALRLIAATAVGLLIAVPLAAYSYLYIVQDSLIFKPQPIAKERLNRIRAEYPAIEEINIRTPDNVKLHGWFLRGANKEKGHMAPAPLLIHFLGNADEASDFLSDSEWLGGRSILLMNYRGYGLSGGRPSEKNLFNDAVLIYDSFSERDDIDPENIFAIGRSLGMGVAAHLASKRPLRGVILVSPYDSITNVAQELYPYAPISLLIKHPFDSLSLAPSIKTPMLALIGTDDKTIPPKHSQRLVEKWGGRCDVKFIEGADHATILERKEYREAIEGFLLKLSDGL